jgi:hypothetical protein
MANADKGRPTQIVPVLGRNVVIRKLTDVQMSLLLRGSRILSSPNVAKEEKVDMMSTMFEILDSVVVQAEDKKWVLQQQIEGNLELKDMTEWVSSFGDEDEDEDEKKPVVRRGRTRS